MRGHSYEFSLVMRLCTRLVEPPGIDLKPRANRRNIVGSSRVRLHVAKSLTSLNFTQQLPTTRRNMQQGVRCVRLHRA